MKDIISGYPNNMYTVKCRFYTKGIGSYLCSNYRWNCKIYTIKEIDKKALVTCTGEINMDHIQYLIYRGL